jgi:hypothetical protein
VLWDAPVHCTHPIPFQALHDEQKASPILFAITREDTLQVNAIF